jgi:hypothetical protein
VEIKKKAKLIDSNYQIIKASKDQMGVDHLPFQDIEKSDFNSRIRVVQDRKMLTSREGETTRWIKNEEESRAFGTRKSSE